jgi:hypothetical protein
MSASERPATGGSGGTYKDILLVLFLDSSDDSSGNHSLLPRLGQIEVEDSVSSAVVYVRFHLRVAVLGSDVNLKTKRVSLGVTVICEVLFQR